MEREMSLKEIYDELGNIHKEYFLVDHLFGNDKKNPLYRRGTILDRKKLMKVSSLLGWDLVIKATNEPIRYDKSAEGELLRKASAIEQIIREIVDEGINILDNDWWDSILSAVIEQGIADKTLELLKKIGDKSATAYRTSLYTGLITGMITVYIHNLRKNKALKSYEHAYDNLEFLNIVNGAFLCQIGEYLSKDSDAALFNDHYKQLKSWIDKSKNIPLEKIYSRARGFYYILKLRKHYTVSAANIHLSIFENYDGSGYPTGVSGKKIHEFARIARVAYEISNWLINRSKDDGKRELLAHLLKSAYKDNRGKFKNRMLDQDIVNIALNILK
jgi:hypothetical protein